MNADTRARVEAFRRALELAAYERSGEPVPSVWHTFLASFPRGCCELASQTLTEYLKEDGSNLHPYVIGMKWNEGPDAHGHVFVALDGEYIDLTLDQFDGYDDQIVVEPVEYGGQIAGFIQKVRDQGGTLSTRELTFDGIPDQAWNLYAWLKEVADDLLAASGQGRAPDSMPLLVSTEIQPQYRAGAVAGPSDTDTQVTVQKKRRPMTHVGTITECYQPREVRLRETDTQWVSECGLRFRKATGAAAGSGVWSANRLDLKSIRKIQPAQKEEDLNETSNEG
ncbi:hypothetical protein [Enterobacter ludwigii]|uniref:hypothetical protein n=1 Tax=Enterobacter ludwigii TaxID=299767 RepID=UPI00288C56B5|nr:hypothetical protein [Enterobacter ludwigii]WNI98614.1 hypothetical protein RIK67_00870 [Enterobacter ludwigii]WNJ07539.1 hypothetical protein RIK62_23435 [Enterobacter ludwigii]